MEILALLVILWLMLASLYGSIWLVVSLRRRSEFARRSSAVSLTGRSSHRGRGVPQRTSEVEMLRAQVQHLRTEVYALSVTPPPIEKSRARRHRSGVSTDLPRVLRRQVREVRSTRHPLGI